VLMTGAAGESHWSQDRRPVDVFDARGVLETLVRRLGWGAPEVRPAARPPAFLHPGQAGTVHIDGREAGILGVIHPDRAAEWELRDPAVVWEIAIDALLDAPPQA